MSGVLPARPGSGGRSPEPATLFDPRQAQAWSRRRWELRSAQWRAVSLAESIFGRVAAAVLSGGLLDGPLKGVLDLAVPFDDLDSHREREARFAAAAGLDPVLGRVPLVFVFSAAAEAGGPSESLARPPERVGSGGAAEPAR